MVGRSVLRRMFNFRSNSALTQTKTDGKMIPTFIDDSNHLSLKLIEKTKISPDSYIFRFDLPSPNHVPGLKAHQHVKLHAKVDGERIYRKMTPITDDDTSGYMDLLIKIYHKTPEYPDGGVFTQYLDTLEVGDEMVMSGPIHKLCYEGEGVFSGRKVKHLKGRVFKNIVLIAGGTGITPMWQIITQSLKFDKKDIHVWLLFANRTTKDVLLKEELDKLAAENPRFHLWYTVSKTDPSWKFSEGYITKEMISKHLPPPSEDTISIVVGPFGMKKFAVYPALKELGYRDELVI